MARPTKINAETVAEVLRALAAGHTQAAAAAAAGISSRTLRSWLAEGRKVERSLRMQGHDPDEIDPTDPLVPSDKQLYFLVSSAVSRAEAASIGPLEQAAYRAGTEGTERLIEEISGGRVTQRREVVRDGKMALALLDRRGRDQPDPDEAALDEALGRLGPAVAFLVRRCFELHYEAGRLDAETFEVLKRSHVPTFGAAIAELVENVDDLDDVPPVNSYDDSGEVVMASPQTHPHLYAIGAPEYTGPVPEAPNEAAS